MKKKYNWISGGLVALYVLLLLILEIAAYRLEIEFLYHLTALYEVAIFPISIVTVVHFWYQAVPEQRVRVKVYSKGQMEDFEFVGRHYHTVYKDAVSFMLPDKTFLTFPLNPEIYNSIFPNDEGTLVYKQRNPRSKFHFVRFEPDGK